MAPPLEPRCRKGNGFSTLRRTGSREVVKGDETSATRDAGTSVTREATRASRYAILGVFVAGIRRRNPGAVVNALVSFVATYLPRVVEWRYGVEFRPWQRLYLNVGMLAHAVGMLGPYDDVWWWDHVTHAYSSTLLGGFVHLRARRRGRDPRPHVLGVVLCVGVLWELMEYAIHGVCRRIGLEPLLIPYGREDTLFDLVFDLLGALLVIALGGRLLPDESGEDGESGEER
jgi:hypothetical protein